MFTFPPWITICHHSYLESKLSTRTIQFLPVRLLDTIGQVAMLFEHVCGFLPETSRPGENVILTYEQMKDLGAITSSAIRLLRNASASLSTERRKGVLNKVSSKGTLASPASEEFPQAGKSLFGEWIRSKDQDQIRDSKDLILSTASVGQNSRPAQYFFPKPHHPIQKTREPLGWCQSKVSKFQQLRPVSGFIQRPRQSLQRSPAANPSSHPVEKPSHLITTKYDAAFKSFSRKLPPNSKTPEALHCKLGDCKQRAFGPRNCSRVSSGPRKYPASIIRPADSSSLKRKYCSYRHRNVTNARVRGYPFDLLGELHHRFASSNFLVHKKRLARCPM